MEIGIPGIDEKSFLDLFEGDTEMYMTVLHAFVEKAPAVLNKLRTVSAETLHDYGTYVHGMKGSCASICAEEAKNTAFELEKMARDGNLSGVLAKNADFLKYMDDLVERLRKRVVK